MPSQFSTVLATELSLRDDLLGTISDFYKDAHGVRPVSYTHLTLPTTPYV